MAKKYNATEQWKGGGRAAEGKKANNFTSTMAPAASVKVGEISSKSRLSKIQNFDCLKLNTALKKIQLSKLRKNLSKIQSKFAAGFLDGSRGQIIFKVGTIQIQFRTGCIQFTHSFFFLLLPLIR